MSDKITILVFRETSIDNIREALSDLEVNTEQLTKKPENKAKELTLILKD